MPISINGSGTVTGISVGGLPDGIVDTDMLANGAATAVKRGSGSILQTVNGTFSSQVERTSAGFTDTGLTANITTTGSNKVLIFVCQALEARQYNSTGFAQGKLALIRTTSGSSSNVFLGTNKSIVVSGPGSGDYFVASGCIASIVAEDSPSAGTHTYKTQIEVSARSGTAIRSGSESHPAEIILMEVAA